MAFPDYMNEVEQRIVGNLIRKALTQGLLVSVFDGEEWPLKRSADIDQITEQVAATDITTLRFFRTVEDKQVRVGDVLLVHGNEDDVIGDHTDNEIMEELCRQ